MPSLPAPLPAPSTTSADLLSALDWALAQNQDARSPLHGKIDPKAVAISGYSCGGLQALQISAAPRVKTLIVMNSGIFKDATQGINCRGRRGGVARLAASRRLEIRKYVRGQELRTVP